MQINLYSTRTLGNKSIDHIKGLINNFKWNNDLLSCSINIDSTLRDVDDLIYLQLVCGFQDQTISYISEASNMTEALKSAMKMISKKMIRNTNGELKIKRKVHIAA